jgi:hypothetical protein
MRDELQNELDKNKSFVLKYSMVFLILIIFFMLLSLTLLKIQNKSILMLAKDYFIR